MARAWQLPRLAHNHPLAGMVIFAVSQARATFHPLAILCDFFLVEGWEKGIETILAHSPERFVIDLVKRFQLEKTWGESVLQKRLRELASVCAVLRQGSTSAVKDCLQRSQSSVVITFLDEAYPKVLLSLEEPPPVLWMNRALPKLEEHSVIAMIGSRQMTLYGSLATESLVRELVSGWNYWIVSGCAPGVDSEAHKQTLQHGGSTVGVLACGLDQASPRVKALFQHKDAYLITEFPPGTPPDKWQFRHRNRLISGLAQGVVVVEAGANSGTMITAHAALDQSREVMVVPQSIFGKNIAGIMHLQHEGVTFVTSAWDIHETLHPRTAGESRPMLSLERWERYAKTPLEQQIVRGVVAWQGQVLEEVLFSRLGARMEVSREAWRQALFALEQRRVLRKSVGVLTLSRMIQS